MSSDWFSFEREGVDFPFYKDNPKLNKWEWGLLLISVLAFLFCALMPNVPDFLYLIYFLSPVVILVSIRFELYLLFKKLTKKDNILIFKITILSLILGIFLLILLSQFIIFPDDPDFLELPLLLQTIIYIFFAFFEELFKFGVFILVLALVYRLSNNRKKGIIYAAFITMLLFGVTHQENYVPMSFSLRLILSIILQGFGSIFDIYAYVKTKNLLLSWFTHFIFNTFISYIYVISCFLDIDL